VVSLADQLELLLPQYELDASYAANGHAAARARLPLQEARIARIQDRLHVRHLGKPWAEMDFDVASERLSGSSLHAASRQALRDACRQVSLVIG